MDSLINYETVKLYGNEEHELKRYDRCLAGNTFEHFIFNRLGLNCSAIWYGTIFSPVRVELPPPSGRQTHVTGRLSLQPSPASNICAVLCRL